MSDGWDLFHCVSFDAMTRYRLRHLWPDVLNCTGCLFLSLELPSLFQCFMCPRCLLAKMLKFVQQEQDLADPQCRGISDHWGVCQICGGTAANM